MIQHGVILTDANLKQWPSEWDTDSKFFVVTYYWLSSGIWTQIKYMVKWPHFIDWLIDYYSLKYIESWYKGAPLDNIEIFTSIQW